MAGIAFVGWAVGLASSYAWTPRSPTPSRPPVPRSEPSAQTAAGAAAAATAFVTAIDYRVMVDDRRRRAAVSRFAAPGATTALAAQLTHGLDALRTSVAAGDVVSAPALLGYRVRRFTPNRASVSVWGVLLFGTALEPARSLWRTSTVELAWWKGAWRVARHIGRDGPSATWPARRLAIAAGAFRGYRYEP
jgi:hypothetical protein